MINDNTIDKDSAKFWSIFSDKKLTMALNKILADEVQYNQIGVNKAKQQDQLSEGGGGKVGKSAVTKLLSKALKSKAAKRSAKALTYGTAGGGSIYIAGTLSGKGAENLGKGIGKGIDAAGSSAKENGGSLLGFALGAVGIIGLGAAVWSLIKNKDKFSSTVKNVVNKVQTGKCLAKCTFISDGNDYEITFDDKKKLWQFNQNVSKEDSMEFFDSSFFRSMTSKFYAQFSKYLNNSAFNVLQAAGIESKEQYIGDGVEDFMLLMKDTDMILLGLKNGKHEY